MMKNMPPTRKPLETLPDLLVGERVKVGGVETED
jgi:hypothetical protein